MNRIVLLMLFIIGCATTAIAGGYSYVEQDQFKQWLGNSKDMAIVDIQVPAEFQQHHFKGSLETNAFPVKSPEEKEKLDKIMPRLLASHNDVVIVCPRGGGGAKNTYDYLKEKGISEKRLFILEKGMQGWPYQELTVAGK
jgi:rhodanese-related sulfurtransferase